MSFEKLGLRAELLKALDHEGYTNPTTIQEKAIPPILQGCDILGGSQTGTGKTAAFTLPLLQRLIETPGGHPSKCPRVLVLTPTRELAAQVGESVTRYGTNLPLNSTTIFGGVGMGAQVKRLRQGVDIVVATPGRLLDHAGQRTIDLSQIEILVLDEADRMLDMGFIRDIRRILALMPDHRQNLLFSATYSKGVRDLADSLLHDPVVIEVAKRNTTAKSVQQVVYRCAREHKRSLLSHLIRTDNWQQVLVFTRTKHGANRLAKTLERDGITTAAIHGNKSQGARTRALADFKKKSIRVLVATDIAARGLDIEKLPHVVNFELPNVPEDYIHRIGRTGRAGETGIAHSIVSSDEADYLKAIERLLKRQLPVEKIAGFKAPASAPDRRNTQDKQNGGRRHYTLERKTGEDDTKPRRTRRRRRSGNRSRSRSTAGSV